MRDCGGTFFAKKVPPHPFKKALAKIQQNRFVSAPIGGIERAQSSRFFVKGGQHLAKRKEIEVFDNADDFAQLFDCHFNW